MSHNPPPGLGMAETIFRGGKGDFPEGGVRVPAQAWWPGVIKPSQIVGDIPLEYVEHLDQLPFDPAGDPDLGE